jgi:type IV secretory pathway VirB10-like protein
LEEGEGSKNVCITDASGVHIEDVGSSSELPSKNPRPPMPKEERQEKKEKPQRSRQEKLEKRRRKSSVSKTRRREKKKEEAQERQGLREGQQELKSKRRMSMMHHLVSSLVARTMEMMMYHTMLQKIARR